jgi:hsp70-interacting protein
VGSVQLNFVTSKQSTIEQLNYKSKVREMAPSGDPFAWLGLLKWSLAYSDGTKPSEGAVPMSPEDKAFLEKVMKEGIIDENERMKTILKEVTTHMEVWRSDKYTDEQAEIVEDLLQELRDIVEQIDYARAFAAMKGLNFLLGCVQERSSMPKSTRLMCLGLIATLCQHNPPVQKELLELGSIGILSDLFFATTDESGDAVAPAEDENGELRAQIIQAISANVRSHDLAEAVFCQLDQAPRLLALGLGAETSDNGAVAAAAAGSTTKTPTLLRKRTLFFLRALVTSDTASRERVRRFAACIVHAIDSILLVDGDDSELVELGLAMVEQMLEQKTSVDAVLARKDPLAAAAVRRVSAIRMLTGQNREFAEVELGYWERILALLARAAPDTKDLT